MRSRVHIVYRRAQRLIRREEGAALVEFSLVMPVMLLLLAVAIESGRVYWSYQMAISGVRDAARYLGRVAPLDICASGGSLSGYSTSLKTIVEKDIGGASLFPASVTVNSVTPGLGCIGAAGTYRTSPAPVATVTASLTIDFPFSGIMSMFGTSLPQVTMTVADQHRVFGQ